ncbi:hypothetical protein HK097_009261 [Rhizophlyctis rosea]|uniref:Phosducin domain-containing protein n=1 Tax=Rhizophlyctis rosea TaxID=64517 RepID=A0AAD5XAB7_9FUNG|nr:hypothetical protein HK097_009261 [Rhizophlyctis rosea]
MMSEQDRAILRAIERATDPEHERPRHDSDDDNSDSDSEDHSHSHSPSHPTDPSMERIVSDNQTRQSLGVGGAFTGPKGVLADYKFHQHQERARQDGQRAELFEKLNRQALSSGWLTRQMATEAAAKAGTPQKDEEDEDALLERLETEDDEYLSEYRANRLAHLQSLASKPRFGTVEDLTFNTYVPTVEDVPPSTIVIVHLYEPHIEACRLTNSFLETLAQKYPTVKFARIVSKEADSGFDEVALPALIGYRGGDVFTTVMRITLEVEGWEKTGLCNLEEFEGALIEQGLLDGVDKVAGAMS